MAEKDACKLCGEKLEKETGDALYYCLKCSEKRREGGENERNERVLRL